MLVRKGLSRPSDFVEIVLLHTSQYSQLRRRVNEGGALSHV